MRRVYATPFCYHCGRGFLDSTPRTRDHVPSRAAFSAVDLTECPLILPAHESCNNSNTSTDKRMGQLVSLRHGSRRRQRKLESHLRAAAGPDGKVLCAMVGVDLKKAIWRWIRAFHAALYGEFLPDTPHCSVLPPLPAAHPAGGRMVPTPILPQYELFAELIKQSRNVGRLDSIRAFGSRLRYDCVWITAGDGRLVCVFALDLYGWSGLGSPNWGRQRCCMGHYLAPQGLPTNASHNPAKIALPLPACSPLDAFEEADS